MSRQLGARLRPRKFKTPSPLSWERPAGAAWSLLKLAGEQQRGGYAFCRPGAAQYIEVPGNLFDTGACGQDDIKVRELHAQYQQHNHQPPVAFTSTMSGSDKYVVFPESVRRVKSLLAAREDDIEFDLHPKCRGARHYMACTNELFYLIFEQGGSKSSFIAQTSSLQQAADWKEFALSPFLRGADAVMFDSDELHAARGTEVSPAMQSKSSALERDGLAEVVFSFTCGDTRAAGDYIVSGVRNSRPEYCRLDDKEAVIYWNSAGEWISYVEGYKGASSLYSCTGDGKEPCGDWDIEFGDYPGPALNMSRVLLEVSIGSPMESSQLFSKLKMQADRAGLFLPPVDRSQLVMTDVHGHSVRPDVEPDWTSLRYPLRCTYLVQRPDLASSMGGAAFGRDVVHGRNSLDVLRGTTVTKYACNERFGAEQVLEQSHVSQQLDWHMSQIKARPAISPTSEPVPHLEWAVEALHRFRKQDPGLLERVLGVKTSAYSNDAKGVLDMLSDIGPRLQAADLTSDPIELELQGIVGLEQVKTQLRTLRKSLRMDARRRAAGVQVPKPPPHHMVFTGNPGVGKTTMGRLVAKILREVGSTKGGRLVEVQRGDLVGQHVGSTAPKTRKAINAAKGGVLFVDEAYRLTGHGSQDFGPEAVEEIMKDLDDGDPVVIVAGYEDRMQRFFEANPGLRRRFRHFFRFANYNPHQIAEMFWAKLRRQGFFVEHGITVRWIADLVEDNTTSAWRGDHNGCIGDLLFDHAKHSLDDRLCIESASRSELQTLSCQDLRYAAASLQGSIGPDI